MIRPRHFSTKVPSSHSPDPAQKSPALLNFRKGRVLGSTLWSPSVVASEIFLPRATSKATAAASLEAKTVGLFLASWSLDMKKS